MLPYIPGVTRADRVDSEDGGQRGKNEMNRPCKETGRRRTVREINRAGNSWVRHMWRPWKQWKNNIEKDSREINLRETDVMDETIGKQPSIQQTQ